MVALSGIATGPASIQIAPASLHFAPQSSGTASAPQAITVTNTGASALSINGFGMSGANISDYSQTNNCPPSLNGGGSCVVNVVVHAHFSVGYRRATANLNISDNAAGSPQLVGLSGTATQASIQISPTSINFGGQQAGTASSSQTITVTNTGAGNLSFTSIAMSSGADFVIGANTCSGAQTPPGSSCTVQLSFSPACTNGVAARSANLLLTDNVPGSPQSVALSGSATGDFCFAAVGGATVTPGQTATYTLVVNSATGYRGSVSVTCANFPAATACSVPASVTVPSQFAVSVTTAANSRLAPFSQRRSVVAATRSDPDWFLPGDFADVPDLFRAMAARWNMDRAAGGADAFVRRVDDRAVRCSLRRRREQHKFQLGRFRNTGRKLHAHGDGNIGEHDGQRESHADSAVRMLLFRLSPIEHTAPAKARLLPPGAASLRVSLRS